MQMTNHAAGEQTRLWNGAGGRAWAESQELLDEVFRPMEELLVEAVGAGRRGRRVLDVGCGAGGVTLALARRFGSAVECTGVDLSGPMIATARGRAEREGAGVRFIQADAGTYAFEAGSFDVIVSRFGVMFFHDPVGAFANLRRAAHDGAELRMMTWRGEEENPFMVAAERAAAPLLPNLPVRRANEPGQFAFADPRRVESILGESGWGGIDIRAVDVTCRFPEAELTRYLTRLGPVGRALADVDAGMQAEVVRVVRAAFEPFVHENEVRFTAACGMVSATAAA